MNETLKLFTQFKTSIKVIVQTALPVYFVSFSLAVSSQQLNAARSHRSASVHASSREVENKEDALESAITSGSMSTVKRLVEEGVPLNLDPYRKRKYPNGYVPEKITPLMFACWSGHFDVAIFLLAHGANPKAVDKYKQTVLLYACEKIAASEKQENLRLQFADLLVKRGVKVNAASIYGYTALRNALYSGDPKIVKWLLQKGAKIDKKGVIWENYRQAYDQYKGKELFSDLDARYNKIQALLLQFSKRSK